MIALALAYFGAGYRIEAIDGERWRMRRAGTVVWVDIPAGWVLP